MALPLTMHIYTSSVVLTVGSMGIRILDIAFTWQSEVTDHHVCKIVVALLDFNISGPRESPMVRTGIRKVYLLSVVIIPKTKDTFISTFFTS